MKTNPRQLVAIFEFVLALIMPLTKAFADGETVHSNFEESESLPELTAQWWQWALSIPAPLNPRLDPTGENGVVVKN